MPELECSFDDSLLTKSNKRPQRQMTNMKARHCVYNLSLGLQLTLAGPVRRQEGVQVLPLASDVTFYKDGDCSQIIGHMKWDSTNGKFAHLATMLDVCVCKDASTNMIRRLEDDAARHSGYVTRRSASWLQSLHVRRRHGLSGRGPCVGTYRATCVQYWRRHGKLVTRPGSISAS